MAVMKIVLHPNDVLTTPCQPVERVDDEVRQLVADMAETMYAAPGVGLAAPQVGVLLRVAVIDITPKDEPKNLLVLINPEIIAREGHIVWEEGCLSIPRVYEKIDRSKKVTVRALGVDGQPFEVTGEGLLAVALQHELDHLDGVLFFDRMSILKRKRAQKKYKKILEAIERGDFDDPDEEDDD
jgi:peptide deformylase